MEKIFIFLSWLTQGSSYLSPYAYGVLHRLHHAYADTEKDPHSPKYDKNIWAMMWRTRNTFLKIMEDDYPVEEKFRKDLPYWKWFDDFASSSYSRVAWGAFYVLFYMMFATSWWMFLLLPIHFLMGPFHGAIINWFSHRIGWRRFKTGDTSTNLLPVDFLMLGESYHNNHHSHPGRANFGIKWYEFDPVYPFIRLFHWMGIIKVKTLA